MLEQIRVDRRYKAILPLFEDEYKTLLFTLKHQPMNPDGYTLIDCLRHSQGEGRFNPITFGDSYVDEDGIEQCVEPELLAPEDRCTKQALDYIFQLVPNNKDDYYSILKGVPNNSIRVAQPDQL